MECYTSSGIKRDRTSPQNRNPRWIHIESPSGSGMPRGTAAAGWENTWEGNHAHLPCSRACPRRLLSATAEDKAGGTFI